MSSLSLEAMGNCVQANAFIEVGLDAALRINTGKRRSVYRFHRLFVRFTVGSLKLPIFIESNCT